MKPMTDKPKPDKQRPGPKEERLVIDEDPETALSKLLRKPATTKTGK